MKKFVVTVLLFFAILSALVVILGRGRKLPVNTSGYMAAIIDKHARLDQTRPPRIIFAGGSNLAFGIDSRQIEDSTGMPVINLGLHGSLGLDFIIREVKQAAQPGDIIIFSPEYYLGTEGSYRLKKETARCYPPAGAYFTHNFYTEAANYFEEGLHRNLKKTLARWWKQPAENDPQAETSALYLRSSFNSFGDVVAHLNTLPPAQLRDRKPLPGETWEGIGLLNDFSAYAKSRNISAWYLFPCYPVTEFTANKGPVSDLASSLESGLEMPLLCRPGDVVFPDSLFFDTVYHLNKEGREKRTRLILRLFKAHGIGTATGTAPST